MSHHITKGKSQVRYNKVAMLSAIITICAISLLVAGDYVAAATSLDSDVFKPLGDASIAEIIGRVIRAIIGLSGVIALAMFVYGGLIWMTSAGNSERAQKAKTTIIWSALGLVLIFGAYALVSFVLSALGQG
jgi:cbb3-type cytochrome oxidase subunit 3